MDLQFSPEEEAFRAEVRAFLKDNLPQDLAAKVKAGLVTDPVLKGMEINVDTEGGVVMLSGFVESKAEADKAMQVAKGVDGVTNVKSAIKVK